MQPEERRCLPGNINEALELVVLVSQYGPCLLFAMVPRGFFPLLCVVVCFWGMVLSIYFVVPSALDALPDDPSVVTRGGAPHHLRHIGDAEIDTLEAGSELLAESSDWLDGMTAAQRHTLWESYSPRLPSPFRLDVLGGDGGASSSLGGEVVCGPWWTTYVKRHQRLAGVVAPHVVPAATSSHGIGDWEMQLLREGRMAVEAGEPLFVDWPAAFATKVDPDAGGALSRRGAVDVLFDPATHGSAGSYKSLTSSPEGGAALEQSLPPPEAAPAGPLGDACVYGLFLPPSLGVREHLSRTRRALADPGALTIGVHVRAGGADGRRNSKLPTNPELDMVERLVTREVTWRSPPALAVQRPKKCQRARERR